MKRPSFYSTLVTVCGLTLSLWANPAAYAGTIAYLNNTSDTMSMHMASEYPAVGSVMDQSALGSGTLIAPQWVLTAGHVVGTSTQSTFHVNTNYYDSGQTYQADSWYTPASWDYNLEAGNDIALIHLSQPVTGVTPMQMYSGTGNGDIHQVDKIVGFGVVGDGYPGDPRYFTGYKHAGQNYIDGHLWQGTPFQVNNIMTTRMDVAPWDSKYTGPYADPQFLNPTADYPLADEYLINHGDSGGPNLNGDNQITAVHSFGLGLYDGVTDSSFSDIAGSTRVAPWLDWINTVMYDVNHGITPPAADTAKGTPGNAMFSALEMQSLIQANSANLPIFNADELAILKQTYPNIADHFTVSQSAYGFFLAPIKLGTPVSSLPTPEPTSLALLAAAGVPLLLRRQKRAA